MGGWIGVKSVLRIASSNQKDWWWMDGWISGLKAVLRIALSNQKRIE